MRRTTPRRADTGREAFLHKVFETSPLAMLVGDDDRRCVDANGAALRLLAIERDALIGARIDDFLLPRGVGTVEERWTSFLASGETRLRRGDGEVRVFDYEAKANVLPGRHVAMMRDITDRKQAEADGRATRDLAEEQYRSIVETKSEGVWLLDAAGVTTFANARMEDLLGYGPGGLVGRPLGALVRNHGGALAPAQAELALRHRDGQEVWALVSSTPRTDPSGAREPDIRTIAEGVEDAGTLDLLRELDVDFAQGYFIGRPAPVAP